RVYPAGVATPAAEEAERIRNERRLAALGIARAKARAMPMEAIHVGDAGEAAVVEGVKGERRVGPADLGGRLQRRTAPPAAAQRRYTVAQSSLPPPALPRPTVDPNTDPCTSSQPGCATTPTPMTPRSSTPPPSPTRTSPTSRVMARRGRGRRGWS